MFATAYQDNDGDFNAALALTKIAQARPPDETRPLRKGASRKVVSLAATGAYDGQFADAGGDVGAAIRKALNPASAQLLYSAQLGERPT